jgi:hypothetical protein
MRRSFKPNDLDFLGGTDGLTIDDLSKMRRNCNVTANTRRI